MTAIPAELCIGGRDLTEPRLAPGGDVLTWAVSQAGTAWLEVQRLADDRRGERTQLATTPALRAGRGLGGGAWCYTADAAAVIYVGADGNLWRQRLDGDAAQPLTDHGPDRASSGPVASADGRWVVHVLDQAEVWAVDLHDGSARRVDLGTAHFCIDPWVGVDGSVRWVAWDVPHMPWDHSRVQWASLSSPASGEHAMPAAVQQARQLPDGTAACVRDDTGWLNVWVGDAPLVAEELEHAGPTWGPGQRSYTWSPDGAHVAFTRNERGFGRLCVAHRATGDVREVARAVHGQLSWEGTRLAAVRTGARTPTQVVVYDTESWERRVVDQGPAAEWSTQFDTALVEPTLVEIPAPSARAASAAGSAGAASAVGDMVHARLYAADEPDGRLIVWLHGGPTDQWQVSFMPRVAYWRSRGWSVLVPDHRGSTGHGRAYQQALRGRWGELDVADVVAATEHAHRKRWGAPELTVLIGGSAGGFTGLGAVAAAAHLFAAAVFLYPVTDLVDMAERSHRFERHYTDSLVGPLPGARELYEQRSPVLHIHRFTATPLLLLHGDLDPVVPLEQSQVLAERITAAGGTVTLHVYAGEGHGFRQPANQLDEYRRIGEFLQRHVPIGSRA